MRHEKRAGRGGLPWPVVQPENRDGSKQLAVMGYPQVERGTGEGVQNPRISHLGPVGAGSGGS